MAIIAKTTLNTPCQLGGLSLCKGFPLFPTLGSVDAGISSANSNSMHPIITAAPTVGLWRCKAEVGYGFFFGICGPAYATMLALEGSADETRIDLTLSESETRAGLEAGSSLTLGFAVHIEQFAGVRVVGSGWDRHLEAIWVGLGAVEFDLKIDLIGLLLDYLESRKKKETDKPDDKQNHTEEGKVSWASGTSLAAVGAAAGELASEGAVELFPSVSLLYDATDYFIKELPGDLQAKLEQLREKLEELGGGLHMGPTLDIGCPVDVKITKVRTDGREYEEVEIEDGHLTGAVNPEASTDVGPSEIEVVLEHSVGFSLGLGFEAKIYIQKVFSLSGKVTVDVLDLLARAGFGALVGHAGPYESVLRGAIGQEFCGDAAVMAGACGARMGRYEVVLEEPGPPCR
jgi:hypothetical protein